VASYRETRQRLALGAANSSAAAYILKNDPRNLNSASLCYF